MRCSGENKYRVLAAVGQRRGGGSGRGRGGDDRRWTVFPTRLGWMALIVGPQGVEQLTFGFDSAEDARRALEPDLLAGASRGAVDKRLVRRLQAYAAGKPDDFQDVACNLGPFGAFRSRVVAACRAIPYGKTVTYAQLAKKAGSPAAARAVGNCMAGNRVPLIIPCHRVVASSGGLGGYSGGKGIETKRELIEMEELGRAAAR